MDDEAQRRHRFEVLMGEVYEPLQRYVLRRCRPSDADDVLNEALLTIWRRLDEIPDGAALPWCYGVARRCLANHRRGDARRLRLIGRARSTAASAANERGHDLTTQIEADLADALGTLPDHDREVLRLWAWEQLEPREIALVLDTSPNAVSVRLSRAKRHLNRELVRQDPAGGGHMGAGHRKEQDR